MLIQQFPTGRQFTKYLRRSMGWKRNEAILIKNYDKKHHLV